MGISSEWLDAALDEAGMLDELYRLLMLAALRDEFDALHRDGAA